MTTGIVKEILLSDDHVGRPILINFQNGILNSDQMDNLDSRLFKDQDSNLIAAVASETNLYSCKISRKEAEHNNYILTRNKKTGECKVIALDRVLLNYVPKSKRKLEITQENSRYKKITDLNKYFGSKKLRRAVEQNERLQVNVDAIKDTLEKTANETHVDEADIIPGKVNENENDYKPPINKVATTVEDIYPLNIVLPPDLLEQLDKAVSDLLEADKDDITLCDITKKAFIRLRTSESSKARTNMKLLLYIDCLINFLKQPAKAASSKKNVVCSYSITVNTHIINNFTVLSATGRTRPMSMRDKCVCYILVLSMIAFEYTLYLEDFSKELKVGVKKLQEISRVLHFTQQKNKTVVTLSLPLPAPAPAGTSPRRKRK